MDIRLAGAATILASSLLMTSASEKSIGVLGVDAKATLTTLHTFHGDPDGAYSYDGVSMDSSGALYGTTQGGGAYNMGTVYKLTPSGSTYTESVIHSFQGPDGSGPSGGLMLGQNGVLFGTTQGGGTGSQAEGVVFMLKPNASGSYDETVLYMFQKFTDGANPTGSLITDSSGALYGTTLQGGQYNMGTVFRLTPTSSGWHEDVLYNFRGGAAGEGPGGLVRDAAGVFYGAAGGGNTNFNGLIYALRPARRGYEENILYTFRGGRDGSGPNCPLLLDDTGALYGTTWTGGNDAAGTVFKLTPAKNRYVERILFRFEPGLQDSPTGLLADHAGDFFGTTEHGGTRGEWGTIYKLRPTANGYRSRIIYSFSGETDGGSPYSILIANATGSLFGTTSRNMGSNYGTVFKVDR